MHFRHVARAIVLPTKATESLPSSVEADGQYSYTFPTQTIPDDFDETKMRAIALLIDGATGEVVNCLGADFNEPQTSAVGSLAFADVPAKLFPNPAAQTTVLEFNCHRAQLASLDILDALGKLVTQTTIALNLAPTKLTSTSPHLIKAPTWCRCKEMPNSTSRSGFSSASADRQGDLMAFA